MRAFTKLSVLTLSVAMLVTFPAVASADEIEADDVVYGGAYSGVGAQGSALDAIAAATGKRVTFGGFFHNVLTWTNSGANPAVPLEDTWQGEATPFVNLEIQASAASIGNGTYDGNISAYASSVAEFVNNGGGRSVILAPLQEANGTWTAYGCDPYNFKKAYKRFVDIFRSQGLDETKVRWAFAPNGWTSFGCGSLADYYPGDGYVDVLAFSGYNFGTCVSGASWDTVSKVVDPWIDELTAINGTKPILISQTAAPRSCSPRTPGGDQSGWTRDLFNHLKAEDNVVGVVWFNEYKYEFGVNMDWRIWTGSWISPGWQDGMSVADHKWPLTDWFAPGPLTVKPPAVESGPRPCGAGPCDSFGAVDGIGEWRLWSELSADAAVAKFFYGNPGDVAFMGDWDGDGTATPGLYRQSDGFVYLRHSNTEGIADVTFFFGNPGDFPLVGDFNNDGRDTVSIYRSSQAKVYVINQLGQDGGGLGAADYSFYFGNPGDTPFVGDFNGDGIDTVGLHRASTGFVYFRDSLTQGIADWSFFYGNPGDVILAGDWNGDGDDTVAVYRPSTGRVYVNLENTAGVADYTLYVGAYPIAVTGGKN